MTNYFAAIQEGAEQGARDVAYRNKRDVNKWGAMAYGATGDERTQALQQMAGADVGSAVELGKELRSAEEAKLRKLHGMATYLQKAIDSGNEGMAQGAWRGILPGLRKEMPQGQFSDVFDRATVQPVLHEVLAMTSGALGGAGGQVQSTKVGEDGFYYTVGRDGSWTNSGIKADPNVQVRDQAGVPLGLIDKRAGTIRGIGEAGGATLQGQPQAAPLPQGSTQKITDAIAASANEMLRRGVPEAEIEAWMLQQEGAEDAVDDIAAPANIGVGAMRPAMSPAQVAANQRAEAAAALAREAADRAARMEGVGTGYKSDGQGGQTFVPGGPADPAVIARNKAAGSNGTGGKALPANVVTKLTKQSGIYDNTEALIGSFSDDYAGNVMTGRAENVLGQLGLPGATAGQSDWWQQYDRQKNEVRNLLFGSALTPGEQAAFEAADIRPNMAPARIRANLKMQADIIAKGLEKQAKVWKAQGYNAEAIDAATSIGTPQASEQSGWGIQRVGD